MSSFTHYYVQTETKEGPVIVYHTYDKKTKTHFHKFLDKNKAEQLKESEMLANPKELFRVVKEVTKYTASAWEKKTVVELKPIL